MAQHDYDLINQSGSSFRADLNNALDAIASNNSGSSQPSTTFAYEWWVDTTNDLLKIRNSANNAWITLPLSVTADNSTSGALTVNGNLTTTGSVDINGQELILDADADTSITADSDDQIDFRVGAVDVMTLTNSHLVLKGTTPKITIGDGGEEDTALIFDGNAQDFYIGLDDSADDLIIGKGSTVGTTPAVVIDENLRVGIGVAPEQNLHILCDSGDEGILLKGTGNTSHALTMDANRSSAGGALGEIRGLWNGTEVARMVFRGGDDTTNKDDGFITFATSTADNISERVRLTSDGSFCIGNTDAFSTGSSDTGSGQLHVAQSNLTAVHFKRAGSDGGLVNFYRGGVTSPVGSIVVTTSATNFNTSSDARLKNVLGEAKGLEIITKLNPVNFEWKVSNQIADGLIAQEVKELVPNAVSINDSGYFQMDYSVLVTPLIKAIQELEARIKKLEE